MKNVECIMNRMVGEIARGNFSEIQNPLHAEAYGNLTPTDKLMLQLKWAKEEYDSSIDNHVINNLHRYDKPKTKTTYRIYNKITEVKDDYMAKSIQDVSNYLNISEHEAKYLKNYTSRTIKNPKFKKQHQIGVIVEEYILNRDGYVLVS